MPFIFRACSHWLPSIICVEVYEMVSVLVCILPSLVSVESLASIPPFTPFSASSLPKPTHPPARPPDIRNSVYSALWLLARAAHQEHLSTLWGKDNQHLPSPAADSPMFSDINESLWCAKTNMCANVFLSINVFFSSAVFGQSSCAVWYIAFAGENLNLCLLRYIWPKVKITNAPELTPKTLLFPLALKEFKICCTNNNKTLLSINQNMSTSGV